MLKYYAEALKRLRADQNGVVSFEYVIVAACIVTTVAAVFLSTGNGSISGALTNAITNIAAKLPG